MADNGVDHKPPQAGLRQGYWVFWLALLRHAPAAFHRRGDACLPAITGLNLVTRSAAMAG